ncbi:MAG TPA: hypothetical protein VHH15_07820, partial [Actinophytocola sp.]|nr:hypothetical protein [Actinophytocola sp.]
MSQPEPGLFRWVSPLGRVYRSRGEPVRPDVPDPDPAPDPCEETAAEVDQRLRRYDPRMLERPATDPPRPPPPPPRPEPPREGEPSPFRRRRGTVPPPGRAPVMSYALICEGLRSGGRS